jgi:hypothetical protein
MERMAFLSKLLRGSRNERLPPPSYSNDAVLARIQEEEGVDRQTARAWFGEMLIFLDLCARSDKVLSPPPEVDKAWHAFLLHSRDYEAYCRERFGKAIYHQPTGEADPAAYKRAYDRRRKYGTQTGAPYIWGIPAYAGSESNDPHRTDGGGGDTSGGRDSGGSSCGGGGCGGGS